MVAHYLPPLWCQLGRRLPPAKMEWTGSNLHRHLHMKIPVRRGRQITQNVEWMPGAKMTGTAAWCVRFNMNYLCLPLFFLFFSIKTRGKKTSIFGVDTDHWLITTATSFSVGFLASPLPTIRSTDVRSLPTSRLQISIRAWIDNFGDQICPHGIPRERFFPVLLH